MFCKNCGKEIDEKAVICPNCGVPVDDGKKKKKKKHPVLGGILLFLGVLLIFAAIGGGGDEPEKVGDMPDASTKQEEKTTFSVGEQVELNDVIVTLTSVTENYGSAYNKPADGNVFILCEFNIENNSSKDIAVSSLMCFEAYVDDYAANMSLSAQLTTDKNQLDGTVAAGKKMSGVIGYEANKDWKEIEVRFTPDFWNGKDIAFTYSK